jgi:hypothetical protein
MQRSVRSTVRSTGLGVVRVVMAGLASAAVLSGSAQAQWLTTENVPAWLAPTPGQPLSVLGACSGECSAMARVPRTIAQPGSASRFMQALDAVAARSDNPARTRRSLLLAAQASHACYASDLPQAELEALIAATGLLPAGQLGPRPRFDLEPNIWAGDGLQGPSGLSTRATLTYSFAPDGTSWGIDSRWLTLPNTLNNTLAANFVFADIGKEWIRQGLASWKRVAGVELTEVADNGIAMDRSIARRTGVGDIRIGGVQLIQTDGGSNLAGTLAYNAYPDQGGDMMIDTAEFIASRFLDSSNNYRYFRNVIAHEHGHGLGFIHQVPCDATKLMEPLIQTGFDVLQIDDRRGAGFGYGDRFSGNSTAALAADLGTLRIPAQPVRLERDLSMARLNGPAPSAAIEWFKFRLDSTQSVSILMVPTGGTYTTGEQVGNGCGGTTASINATSAIDLDMELRGANGVGVLGSSTNNAGVSEFIVQTLAPGEYTVRISSFLPDPGTAVQLYNLQVGITSQLAVPYANAGLNKRINVGEFCQFMGDVNSLTGNFPINSYQWDLDGNGSLETINPRPTIIYTTPGIRRVRLAVVDNNNGNSNDFINVTVIGNAPTVSSVSPNSGSGGSTVPITINGSSLGSPTVTVSSGVTVIGTPNVDLSNINAPITGLSFLVDPNAQAGPRNVTVTTPSGTTTINNAFTITQPVPTFASVSPSSGTPGQTLPIVINGSNFNGVQAVTITGPGTTLTGSPVVNPARTEITGLSVVVASNAAPGTRTIQVNTLGGFATNTFSVAQPPPSNDLCQNAIEIFLGNTLNGTNVSAGTEAGANCASSSNADVFYGFIPACTATYRFETGPSTFDSVLSIHSGCPATTGNIIACNDDITPGSNLGSRVEVTLTGGTVYYIRVAKFGTATAGAFTLTATSTTPPANDACTSAATLAIGSTSFNNCLAATDSGLPTTACASSAGRDLWYQYTADRPGRTVIDTCGSSFDTVLEVFNSACGTATPAIACSDDTPACVNNNSRVSFVAVAGTTYRVRVSGFSGNVGNGTVTRYCLADFNLNGQRTPQDIFDFLTAYFAANPATDFDGNGLRQPADIFAFLTAYFAGC